MPKKERSIVSKINEHKKYRKQCEVRVASGKKLVIFSIVIAIALVLYKIDFWLIGVGLVAFSAGITLIEFWGYKKHDKAITVLTQNT